MIIFGRIEYAERFDLGNDRFVERAALIQFGFVMFRFFFLLVVVVIHTAAVLRTDVVALAVEGGRVVRFPEYFQQFVEGNSSKLILEGS